MWHVAPIYRIAHMVRRKQRKVKPGQGGNHPRIPSGAVFDKQWQVLLGQHTPFNLMNGFSVERGEAWQHED